MATFAQGNVRLGLNSAKLDDGIKRSGRNVNRFSKAAQRDFQNVNARIRQLVGLLTAVAGIQAFRTILRDIDAVAKQSRALGVDIGDLQRVVASLSEQGIDESRIVRSFGRIGMAIDEARNGVATYLDDFERLGITQDQLADGDILRIQREVFKALNNVSDAAERATLAQGLLGRSFAEVVVDIEAFDAAQADYIVNTNAQGTAIENFNDNLAKITTNLGTLFTTAVVESVNSFGTSLQQVNQFLLDNQVRIREIITNIVRLVTELNFINVAILSLVGIKIGRGVLFWLITGVTGTVGNVISLTRSIQGLSASIATLTVASATAGGGGILGLLRSGRFAGLAALTRTLGIFKLIGVAAIAIGKYVAIITGALLVAGVAVTAILAPIVLGGKRLLEWIASFSVIQDFLAVIDGLINKALDSLSNLTGVIITDFRSFAQAAILAYFDLVEGAVRVTSEAFATILNVFISIYQVFEDIGFLVQEGFLRLADVVITAYNAIAETTGLFERSAFDANAALEDLANTARVFERVDPNQFGQDVVDGLNLESLGTRIADGLVGPLQSRVEEVGEELIALGSTNPARIGSNQDPTGAGINATTDANGIESNQEEETAELANDFRSSFTMSMRSLLRGGGLDDVGQSFLDSFSSAILDNSADAFSMFAVDGLGSIFGFNQGGFVRGQGNTDTIPALLTAGEYVLTRDDVSNIEAGGGRGGGNSVVYAPNITGDIGRQTRRIVRQDFEYFNSQVQRAIDRGSIRR